MSVGKVNLPMVDWFQNTLKPHRMTPPTYDRGMCNAYMDAFAVMRRPSRILRRSQCQKKCTRTRKAKSLPTRCWGKFFP